MELAKNIFFNTDKLIENTKVKISYTGDFFQDNSEKVYLHYGFGLLWENSHEIEMQKTELGFQTEIELISADSFSFCFRNENNNWDNNNYSNYIFGIEKLEINLIKKDDILSLINPKKLRKSYMLNKRIRLAIYKILVYVPKLISGNYKRKTTNI